MTQDIMENLTLGTCYWSTNKYGIQFCKNKKNTKSAWELIQIRINVGLKQNQTTKYSNRVLLIIHIIHDNYRDTLLDMTWIQI